MKEIKLLIMAENQEIADSIKQEAYLAGNCLVSQSSYTQGVAKAISEKPSLVLLISDAAEIKAIDMCRKIKHDPRLKNCLVVIISEKASEEEVLKGFDAGADDYIPALFAPKILFKRLERLMEVKESKKSIQTKLLGLFPVEFDQEEIPYIVHMYALNRCVLGFGVAAAILLFFYRYFKDVVGIL